MTNKNIIEFKTLNITLNLKPTMLTDESVFTKVSNAINFLVRSAEKEIAQRKIEKIAQKVADASVDGSTVSLTEDEKESWDNYNAHIKVLDKLIKKTSYTSKHWDTENEVDKIFLKLIALPNMPTMFAQDIDLLSETQFVELMEMAEDYYNSNGKGDYTKMQTQLEYDWYKLKIGGNYFKGVKIKPNATDTKKFLGLFITDIKLDKDNNYDFVSLWADKKKTKGVKLAVNKFLAMYITNRLYNNAQKLQKALEDAVKEENATDSNNAAKKESK